MRFVDKVLAWIGAAVLCMTVFQGIGEGAVTLYSSLSVSERYNDNLFFTETNPKTDYITSVKPSLKLAYSSRDLTLTGRYRGSAEFHARHPGADIYAQNASFNLGLPILSRRVKGFEVEVKEDATYSPELPAYSFGDEEEVGADTPIDETGEDGGDVQLPRNNTFRNRAAVRVSHPWSYTLTTTMNYSNSITRYSRSDLNDSVGHQAGLAWNYQWSENTGWSASYSGSVRIIEHADEVVAHRLGIGAGHRISRSLSVDGVLGVVLLRDGLTRVTFRGGLSKRFKSTGLRLQYTNDIAMGGGLTTAATHGQRIVARMTHEVGRNATAYINLGHGRSRSLSGPVVKISSYTAGAGITVGFLPWLNGSFGYSYLQQESKGTIGVDGRRNLVMFVLSAGAPPWRIVQ